MSLYATSMFFFDAEITILVAVSDVPPRSKKLSSAKTLSSSRISAKMSQNVFSSPAKRTFQAIRIEVNSELSILNKAIEDPVGYEDLKEIIEQGKYYVDKFKKNMTGIAMCCAETLW